MATITIKIEKVDHSYIIKEVPSESIIRYGIATMQEAKKLAILCRDLRAFEGWTPSFMFKSVKEIIDI